MRNEPKKRLIDHSGEKFNDWTLLKIDTEKQSRDTYYLCKCKCGEIKSNTFSNLKNGRTKCCRICSNIKTGEKRIRDFLGKKIGTFTITKMNRVPGKPIMWFCTCECGEQKWMKTGSITISKGFSCSKCKYKINTKHGNARAKKITPEYRTWLNMKNRCNNPKKTKDHRLYVERGIKVCDEWNESFEAFLKYVGKKPGKKYSIDRIDNDGNYEPGNVRWATLSEQSKNRRPFKCKRNKK